MQQHFELSGEVNLKLPKVDSLDQVKKEFIQTADCIKTHLVFPNGLSLDFIHTADTIKVNANKPIIQNLDGSFSFED